MIPLCERLKKAHLCEADIQINKTALRILFALSFMAGGSFVMLLYWIAK